MHVVPSQNLPAIYLNSAIIRILFSNSVFLDASNLYIKITKMELQVIYLNKVQVSNSGENCPGKFYLRKALPAHFK